MFVSGLVSVALFLLAATGVRGFTVSTNKADVRVKENLGIDLSCTFSGDFGSNPRVEWKFKNLKQSQVYVIFDGKPTTSYASRVTMYNSNLRFATVTRDDNGMYDCEVSGNGQFGEARVKLTVLVPPSAPLCRIPSSVTTGKSALLTCHDTDGSPPPKYRWFKNDVPLPAEPGKIASFKNSTYKLNVNNGNLEFPKTVKTDLGQYYCEASNEAGPPQRCRGGNMEIRDLNTGGIVAGVIVALLLVALLVFGIWYANKKGYLPKKSESKPKPSVVYQPTSMYGGGGDDDDDGEFKQKSSFVV
ncbi:F11 receptor, tandem duplicate 1 [Labrus bergylta]|uniref:F11 receptor, tandem duplicate 1 n=1 Tax=Labrus bergylta TaxID=56723 RepID=UPI0033140C36